MQKTSGTGDTGTDWSDVSTGNTWMVRCTVNPQLLREREMETRPTPTPKRIIVVGGGLAGMEAARVLAERGHRVTLYEKQNRLGGQWNVASQLDTKRELYPSVTERLVKELDIAGVTVYLNTEANREMVEKIGPDVVIMATGARHKTLDVAEVHSSIVVMDDDVINGKAQTGERIVVVGGRNVGMEVADLLACRGKKVSLVTMRGLGQNGSPLESNVFRTLRNRLIDAGVTIFPYSPVKEITDNGAYVLNSGQLLFLKADTVVLAVGVEPENTLAKELEGVLPELYCIGDCVEPRNALEAINDGAEIGRRI